TLVAVSHHIGLLWVGMESTTLSVAPLIFHRNDRRSLEAVWKYLVISSVAIALALFGTFFLPTSQASLPGLGRALVLEDLVAHAAGMGPFAKPLLVGFGLASLVVAAAFLLGQRDVKRLLAYSSVEHVGLLVLGLGLGGVGAYGTVLHVVNHAVAKNLMFLAVG